MFKAEFIQSAATNVEVTAPHLFHYLWQVDLTGFSNSEPVRTRYKAQLQLHFQPPVCRFLQDKCLDGIDGDVVTPLGEVFQEYKEFHRAEISFKEMGMVDKNEFAVIIENWCPGAVCPARSTRTTVDMSSSGKEGIRESLMAGRRWWEPFTQPMQPLQIAPPPSPTTPPRRPAPTSPGRAVE